MPIPSKSATCKLLFQMQHKFYGYGVLAFNLVCFTLNIGALERWALLPPGPLAVGPS